MVLMKELERRTSNWVKKNVCYLQEYVYKSVCLNEMLSVNPYL